MRAKTAPRRSRAVPVRHRRRRPGRPATAARPRVAPAEAALATLVAADDGAVRPPWSGSKQLAAPLTRPRRPRSTNSAWTNKMPSSRLWRSPDSDCSGDSGPRPGFGHGSDRPNPGPRRSDGIVAAAAVARAPMAHPRPVTTRPEPTQDRALDPTGVGPPAPRPPAEQVERRRPSIPPPGSIPRPMVIDLVVAGEVPVRPQVRPRPIGAAPGDRGQANRARTLMKMRTRAQEAGWK